MSAVIPNNRSWLGIPAALFVLVVLFVTVQVNFLLFHSLVELFSILVAYSIFVFAWNTRRFHENHFFLFLGIAYLFIGSLDLLHTLTYKGMGIFPQYDANVPTQLWIAARYLESSSLLVAPLFFTRKLSKGVACATYLLICTGVLFAIFYLRVFPDCFIEGSGLTRFKVVSEYIICLLLLGATAHLYYHRDKIKPQILKFLLVALALTILAEISFTFYVSVYGLSNVIGHFCKLLSFYLVYRALLYEGLTNPTDVLAHRLRESEKKFRALFEQSGGHCIILDPNSTDGVPVIVDANMTACQAHGYTREEFIGQPISNIDNEDGKRLIKKRVQEVMEGKALYFENVHVRKDGTEFDVAVNVNRIDIGDDPPLILATEFDITERKIAQEKLLESEEKLRANEKLYRDLVEETPDLITRVDTEGRFIFVNHTALNIFGIRPEQCLGRSAFDFIHPEDREATIAFFNDWLQNGENKLTFENRLVSIDGQRIHHMAWTIRPEHDANGSIIGFASSARDMTEQKLAEEEKIKLENQLRQSQKMEAIGTMAGGIAHDFNNLLAIISGNLELVHFKQQAGNHIEENLEHIKEASTRAQKLVAQILAFSRQEQKELAPVNLATFVSESLKFLRPMIPTTVEVVTEAPEDPVHINADTTQLQQVLINLCSNALHAMNDKGLLRISLEEGSLKAREVARLHGNPQAARYAKLSVSDTGKGMDKKTLDRIFDPFFTTKEVGRGTGMGLSVVHGIIEQHGGFIHVDSSPGQGSTFTLYFPGTDDVEATEERVAKTTLPTGTESILFVDDEQSVAAASRSMLEHLGYNVTMMTSSVKALDLFQAHPEDFDLVITDQTMPKMSGVELAKELLKIKPNIPIILCSGYSAQLSDEDALKIGIRTFCMKPVEMKQLATVAREALDTSKKP